MAIKGNLQYLDVNTLIKSPIKIRELQTDSKDFENLKKSMAMNGFLESDPCIVRHDDATNTYLLIDGLHRSEAAKAVGITQIPCFIVKTMDEAEELRLQFSKNVSRVPTSKSDQIRQILRYCTLSENLHKTQEQIADELGVTQGYVSQVLSTRNLDPEIQEALDNGDLPFAKAVLLGRFIPKGMQSEFLEKAMDESISTITLSDLLKEHRKEILKSGKASADANIRKYNLLKKDELIRRLEVAEKKLASRTDTDTVEYKCFAERVRVLQEILSVDPETLATNARMKAEEKAMKSSLTLEQKLAKYNQKAEELRAQLKAQAASN